MRWSTCWRASLRPETRTASWRVWNPMVPERKRLVVAFSAVDLRRVEATPAGGAATPPLRWRFGVAAAAFVRCAA
jgi:hypothetical protein